MEALDAQELTVFLTRFIAQVKDIFKAAQSFSVNDIDIDLELPGDGRTPNRYRIEFQLELT